MNQLTQVTDPYTQELLEAAGYLDIPFDLTQAQST
jgi:hypothetical protein